MKSKKIKIPQYLVHGKRQTYSVLVFSKKKWLFASYDGADERYEIDGDPAAYQQVKYALAALIANSGKIAYFPIRKPGFRQFYMENYDAVLVRPELQFRRSEWVSLRRQLNKAHRIKDFELYYDPQKLYDHYESLSHSESEMAKVWRDNYGVSSKLEDGTVFFAIYRDICYAYHHAILEAEKDVMDGRWAPIGYDVGPHAGTGYMITPGFKRFLNKEKEFERKQNLRSK